MTEKEARIRAARKKQLKKKKKRRQQLIRMGFCLCLLVMSVGVISLAVHVAGKKNDGRPAGAAAEAVSGGAAGINGDEPRETAAVKRLSELPEMGAVYGVYINGQGWSHNYADHSYGMAPVGGYITAVRATLHNQPENMAGTISYRVNLSGSGWLDWQEDAAEAGNSLGDMPLEAVSMQLTGELSQWYDILYSVLQDNAWTDWVKNGAEAGQSGVGLRVDGVRISVVKKKEDSETYAGGIDPSKPMVALTYDDGPSAKATPRILAALKENGGRATFFMVGQKAEKNPSIIRQMVDQNCEVANHTYDHTLMSKVDAAELASQLARTNQVVADAGGVTPVLMRPCGGVKNEAGMSVIGSISMPAVMWSIDTLDWKTRDAQNTIQTVLDQVKDGDIILMHDLYEATADASDTIIPELVKRGFQLVTVSELSSYRGGMIAGKSYSQFRP